MLNNLTSITGGPNGISSIPKPSLFGLEFSRRAENGGHTFHEFFGISYDANYKIIFLYVMAVVLVLFTLFVINRLLRMPLGRAWEALRDDEIACRSLGLNPTVIKLTAFAIGAAFAGLRGFFAARQGFIQPGIVHLHGVSHYSGDCRVRWYGFVTRRGYCGHCHDSLTAIAVVQ